ncbi:MAG TPA: hypothetical protein VI299_14615 [Polyangiales bacterium]
MSVARPVASTSHSEPEGESIPTSVNLALVAMMPISFVMVVLLIITLQR